MNGYPDDWTILANHIKQRATWKCEHCGHPHDPVTGHTLTVHHLDINKANGHYTNLVALCQRCHLRIQAHYRPGQLWLPAFTPPPWAITRQLHKAD